MRKIIHFLSVFRFFTTKPTGQGTGLDLSMSFDMVTKGHGGTVELNTSEGKNQTSGKSGSIITIKLPIT